MSDISLPGISNNVDVKGIIDKLVKAESKKLERLEEEKTLLDREKSAWSTLGNKIGDLQEAARSLHGFRSPFEDKVAASSDEAVLTATAARTADPSQSAVTVRQVARTERIISDPVPVNTVFDSATLTFGVGEEEFQVYFNGGTLEDLARAINQQAGGHIRAKVTGDTEQTAVLVLESVKTGAENRIQPRDDGTIALMKRLGLFEEGEGVALDTELTSERLVRTEGTDGYEVVREEGVDTLLLEPRTTVEYPLDGPVTVSDTLQVRVRIRAEDITVETRKVEESYDLPAMKSIGSVTVEDVEVRGGSPISGLDRPEEDMPQEPAAVVDDNVFGVAEVAGGLHSPEIRGLDGNFREYTFRLADLVEPGRSIDTLVFMNNNSERRIAYADLTLVDTAEAGGLRPSHLVQSAQDAVVSIDGVLVQRDSNQIDDAIRGVTLDIKGTSEEEVLLSIDYDYEKITGRIVGLIEKYNDLLEFVNTQTKVLPGSDLDDKTEAGIMTGDITIMGFKGKLQRIMMDPYPTSRGRELALLAQIGISMGEVNSNVEEIRGGYLRINEDTFVNAFQQYPQGIKELFGSDPNRDSVVDNGVAFVLDQTLKAYTEPRNGVVASRIRSTESRINQQDDEIEDWNEHIDEYRDKLERDFTLMQQSLHELEQNQKRIENFSNQFKRE